MNALFLAVLAFAVPAFSSETDEVTRSAYLDFMEGRYDKAASGYRYLETVGTIDAARAADLAIVLREDGKPDEAGAHWMKATLLAPQEPFYWNQRGWSYLSLGQLKDARESFRKSIEVSTAAQAWAEAQFGLGLAESIDGNLKAAYPALQAAIARSPYLVPAAAAELGRITVRQRRYPQSVPFFTMSLSQDPSQPEVARAIGEVYEKTGQGEAAWQAYRLALDIDPFDERALERRAKLMDYLERRPTESLPLRRLARPLVREPDEAGAAAAEASSKSPPLRVLLYTNRQGAPAHLTKFYVMASADFRVVDVKIGEVDQGKAGTQFEVSFRPDNRVLELRDVSNNVRYVTKQAFRFEPRAKWGTVLVKSPEVQDIKGVDISDREFRGAVEVVPTPMGFHLVNEVPLEDFLPAVIGHLVPQGSPPEAFKAMAVLMRTRVSAALAQPPENAERAQLTDSLRDLRYDGITAESLAAMRGVRETMGIAMIPPPGQAVEFHKACGWETAAFIQDRPVPVLPLRSPLELERLVHDFPDAKQYDEASAVVPSIWSRWVRVFQADGLRKNLERTRKIGPLQGVRVLRRDPTGRVQALKVIGSRGETLLQGQEEIEAFLSPGSLRSTIFSLQPLYVGRSLSGLIVWGAGTGHGRGLCVAGAVGQSHLGRSFAAILRHYFPNAQLPGYHEPPPKPAPRVRKEPEQTKAKPRLKPPAKPKKDAAVQEAGPGRGFSSSHKKRHPRK
ncbi:MAG TPA: hypothetical protein DCM05_01880 [Elusimicrobia bacterium]|nr:hypothetical protein [Elusimicrobiota bacterium]